MLSTANVIERRRLADWPDTNAAMRDLAETLKACGATWMRYSAPTPEEIIGEGWFVMPKLGEEGELPA